MTLTGVWSKAGEWVLLNAVDCWVQYDSTPNTRTVEQYKQLQSELHGACMQSLEKDAPPEPEPKPITKRRTTRGKVQDAK